MLNNISMYCNRNVLKAFTAKYLINNKHFRMLFILLKINFKRNFIA